MNGGSDGRSELGVSMSCSELLEVSQPSNGGSIHGIFHHCPTPSLGEKGTKTSELESKCDASIRSKILRSVVNFYFR